MSIQSEINRILNFRNLSFQAVRDKGVTVPTDAIIDDLPDYIAAITGGGGMTVVETIDEHGGTVVTITGEEVKLQTKTATPTTAQQTIQPDSNYTGLASVVISAMPSGTAGTPTASKGAVSNHSISVTPSVTNTTGYISGGTKTGTAVTVSASELVSGSQTITDNGTVNVTNLASVTVAIPIVHYYTGSGTPSSSLGTDGDIYLQTS